MKFKTSPQRWFLINLNHQWSITSQIFSWATTFWIFLIASLASLQRIGSSCSWCPALERDVTRSTSSRRRLTQALWLWLGSAALDTQSMCHWPMTGFVSRRQWQKMTNHSFNPSQFVQHWSWTWSQKLGVSLPMPCLTQNFHLFVSHSCAQNWSPPSKFAELDGWSQKIDLAPSSRTMWCERASPSAMGLHPSFERFPGCFQNHVHMLKWMLAKDTKPLPGISLTQDCQQLVDPAKCLPMLWGRGSLHHQQCAVLGLINAAGNELIISCWYFQSMTSSFSVHVNDN